METIATDYSLRDEVAKTKKRVKQKIKVDKKFIPDPHMSRTKS